MFLEELHILEDHQSRFFYGPFDSEQARELFKMLSMTNHKFFWKVNCSKGCPERIKHISHDSLPKGEYKQFPWDIANISLWMSPEDFDKVHKINRDPE